MDNDVFIDVFVLWFVGTLILILFCIGATMKESQPTLFWIVPGLFYTGAIFRIVFRGFFGLKKEKEFIEVENNE